jgi:hypothetical protein
VFEISLFERGQAHKCSNRPCADSLGRRLGLSIWWRGAGGAGGAVGGGASGRGGAGAAGVVRSCRGGGGVGAGDGAVLTAYLAPSVLVMY